jgi:hypothetical protein
MVLLWKMDQRIKELENKQWKVLVQLNNQQNQHRIG